jgi:hypothetical protein
MLGVTLHKDIYVYSDYAFTSVSAEGTERAAAAAAPAAAAKSNCPLPLLLLLLQTTTQLSLADRKRHYCNVRTYVNHPSAAFEKNTLALEHLDSLTDNLPQLTYVQAPLAHLLLCAQHALHCMHAHTPHLHSASHARRVHCGARSQSALHCTALHHCTLAPLTATACTLASHTHCSCVHAR